MNGIRDKADRMAAYARQAMDTELIQYATEIKVRAERRRGELLRDSATRGERSTGGKPSNDATVTTLADIGLTRDQSSRYQQLAAMPFILKASAHSRSACTCVLSSGRTLGSRGR